MKKDDKTLFVASTAFFETTKIVGDCLDEYNRKFSIFGDVSDEILVYIQKAV